MAKFSVGRMWDEHHLKFGVYDGLRLIYTVGLMRIYQHETALDAGRFVGFTEDEQPHKVSIRHDHSKVPMWVQSETWINWIAEHHDGTWSLDLTMHHVGDGTFHFSFDDLPVATMFKLLFA